MGSLWYISAACSAESAHCTILQRRLQPNFSTRKLKAHKHVTYFTVKKMSLLRGSLGRPKALPTGLFFLDLSLTNSGFIRPTLSHYSLSLFTLKIHVSRKFYIMLHVNVQLIQRSQIVHFFLMKEASYYRLSSP